MLTTPKKGLAVNNKRWENPNQYTRVFYGDQNLCEQWITYAQTILTQMLLRPGTQSRNVKATPDVDVRVTCRPNRIKISAGGDTCFATYPDILGAAGDVNNFGYDDRIVHYKKYQYIKATNFYAGSNHRIVPVDLSVGGTNIGSSIKYPTLLDIKKGCTVDFTNSHVVSWHNNNIYLKGQIFTPFLPSDTHNIVIGASYNGQTLAVIIADSDDYYVFSNGIGGSFGSYGQLFYNKYRLITYKISFPLGVLTTVEVENYILYDKADHEARPLGFLKFLDDKKLYGVSSYDRSLDPGGADSNYWSMGIIFDFKHSFLVKSSTIIYKDHRLSDTIHRVPDVIWSNKGEYIMSFIETYGFGFAPPWYYTSYHWTEQLHIDNTMTNLGISFLQEINDTTYLSNPLFEYQDIFRNLKLNLFIYIEYVHQYIQWGAGSSDWWTADVPTLKIDLNGVITSFSSSLYDPPAFPSAIHSPPFYERSTHCVFDGKTIVLCFLDYSLIINTLSKDVLDYKRLNYRLDGVDYTLPMVPEMADIDVTPLSLTNYYDFPKEKLTY